MPAGSCSPRLAGLGAGSVDDKIENHRSGLVERGRHGRQGARASTLNRLGDRPPSSMMAPPIESPC